MENYSWPLNNAGVSDANPCTVENPHITFDLPPPRPNLTINSVQLTRSLTGNINSLNVLYIICYILTIKEAREKKMFFRNHKEGALVWHRRLSI